MYLWQDSIGRPMHWTDSIKNGHQIFVHCGGHHSNKGLKRPVFFCRDKCSYCFYMFADLNISESETCWQDVSSGTTGQCSGVSAWHSAHGEHDPGWRSAADADDLCHWGGFQGSALTTALTSLETHTHRHTHTHTHPHQMNTSALHTLRGQRPNMTHFDYSVLKQQVTGLPRMSSVSLASVQRQHSGPRESWLATCPIYKWAVLSLTSSKPKMSCLHLVRVQSPFQDGSSSLSLERGCADKCSGSYSTFSGERQENNPRDTGVLNSGCFIGDHEAINCPQYVCALRILQH